MEFQADNAKMGQTMDAVLQSMAEKELNPQASSEATKQDYATAGYEGNSPKGGINERSKQSATTDCNQELLVEEKRTKAREEDDNTSNLPQQTKTMTNEEMVGSTSLELSSDQQTTKDTIQIEYEDTERLVKEDFTNLDSTEGKHQENQGVKGESKVAKQGTFQATSKVLGPSRIVKDFTSKADQESCHKKPFMDKKRPLEEEDKGKSYSSKRQKMLLDLQNGNKVKVRCLTLLDSEVKYNMMSYVTWNILERPTLRQAPKKVTVSKDVCEDCCLGVAKATINIDLCLITDDFYVMALETLQEELVLGEGWMKKHSFHILNTPTFLSRPLTKHNTMHPQLMVDPNSIIQGDPSSKSFELDDRCSSKDKSLAKSHEAQQVDATQIKDSLRFSNKSHQ